MTNESLDLARRITGRGTLTESRREPGESHSEERSDAATLDEAQGGKLIDFRVRGDNAPYTQRYIATVDFGDLGLISYTVKDPTAQGGERGPYLNHASSREGHWREGKPWLAGFNALAKSNDSKDFMVKWAKAVRDEIASVSRGTRSNLRSGRFEAHDEDAGVDIDYLEGVETFEDLTETETVELLDETVIDDLEEAVLTALRDSGTVQEHADLLEELFGMLSEGEYEDAWDVGVAILEATDTLTEEQLDELKKGFRFAAGARAMMQRVRRKVKTGAERMKLKKRRKKARKAVNRIKRQRFYKRNKQRIKMRRKQLGNSVERRDTVSPIDESMVEAGFTHAVVVEGADPIYLRDEETAFEIAEADGGEVVELAEAAGMAQQIAAFLRRHPDVTYGELATTFRIGRDVAQQIMLSYGRVGGASGAKGDFARHLASFLPQVGAVPAESADDRFDLTEDEDDEVFLAAADDVLEDEDTEDTEEFSDDEDDHEDSGEADDDSGDTTEEDARPFADEPVSAVSRLLGDDVSADDLGESALTEGWWTEPNKLLKKFADNPSKATADAYNAMAKTGRTGYVRNYGRPVRVGAVAHRPKEIKAGNRVVFKRLQTNGKLTRSWSELSDYNSGRIDIVDAPPIDHDLFSESVDEAEMSPGAVDKALLKVIRSMQGMNEPMNYRSIVIRFADDTNMSMVGNGHMIVKKSLDRLTKAGKVKKDGDSYALAESDPISIHDVLAERKKKCKKGSKPTYRGQTGAIPDDVQTEDQLDEVSSMDKAVAPFVKRAGDRGITAAEILAAIKKRDGDKASGMKLADVQKVLDTGMKRGWFEKSGSRYSVDPSGPMESEDVDEEQRGRYRKVGRDGEHGDQKNKLKGKRRREANRKFRHKTKDSEDERGMDEPEESVAEAVSIKVGTEDVTEIGYSPTTGYYLKTKTGAKNSPALPPAQRKNRTAQRTKFRQMLRNEWDVRDADKLIAKLDAKIGEAFEPGDEDDLVEVSVARERDEDLLRILRELHVPSETKLSIRDGFIYLNLPEDVAAQVREKLAA